MKKEINEQVAKEIKAFEKKNGKDLAYRFNGKRYLKSQINA